MASQDVEEGDRILVAQGTYKPGTDRQDSFVLKSGVEVWGGYAGYYSGDPNQDPDERSVALFEAILSGDIGTLNESSDNSYHVVDGRQAADARLDGFTIVDGNANYNGTELNRQHQKHGGGAITDNGVFYVNCIFKLNHAEGMGGAISSYNVGGVMVYNCSFFLNSAKEGGAVYAHGSQQPQRIVNCVFNLNQAAVKGGGIRAEGEDQSANCSLFIDDCTFWDDYGYTGGGVFAQNYAYVQIQSSIFWANDAHGETTDQLGVDIYGAGDPAPWMHVYYCCVEGGLEQTGATGHDNITSNPQFVDADEGLPFDDDLHLNGPESANPSPCYNKGSKGDRPLDTPDLDEDDDATEKLPVDRDYIARVIAYELDMGVYEVKHCPGDVNEDGNVDIDDIFAVLAAWGPCEDCPEDVNGDDTVDIDDLFAVLADWDCGKPNAAGPPQSVLDCISLYASDPEDLATCIEAITLTGGG